MSRSGLSCELKAEQAEREFSGFLFDNKICHTVKE